MHGSGHYSSNRFAAHGGRLYTSQIKIRVLCISICSLYMHQHITVTIQGQFDYPSL